MEQIKIGDEVITRSGMRGTVIHIYGDHAIIDIGLGKDHPYSCCIQACKKEAK